MTLFSPLGPRASTTRPASTADSYGSATWYKNCSAAGAADGTVPDASWFNTLIGNWRYAATQAGITTTNDQTNDTFIYQIIVQIVNNAVAAALGGTSTVPTTGGGTVGNWGNGSII